MAFAPIFDCPGCGEVWRDVEMVEQYYGDDEVDLVPVCVCGSIVTQKFERGMPVMQALTQEEIWEEQQYYLDDGEE